MAEGSRAPRRALAACVILFVCSLAPPAARAQTPSLTDDLVSTAGFARADIERAGDAPLARELSVADPSRGAAYAGIVRIRSDGAALADALTTPEKTPPPKGAHARGRFHDPAQPADVAGIEFSDAELEALADCKVAVCKFKLGKKGIDALATIDWSRPDAGVRFTEGFRSEALAYVDGYRKSGNAALVLYADKAKPIALGATLESLLAQFEVFRRQAPGFTGYLLGYPNGRRPGMADTILWQMADFGYRPTLVVDHLVVDRQPEAAGAVALLAAKTLYANHYLAGRIQMGAVLDGPTALGVPGRFVLVVDRIEFDDALAGFKRTLLGRGLEKSLLARLEMLRGLADGAR